MTWVFAEKLLKRYLHPSKEISKLQTKITSEKKNYKKTKKNWSELQITWSLRLVESWLLGERVEGASPSVQSGQTGRLLVRRQLCGLTRADEVHAGSVHHLTFQRGLAVPVAKLQRGVKVCLFVFTCFKIEWIFNKLITSFFVKVKNFFNTLDLF